MYYVVKISVLYTSKVAFKNAVWYYIVQMLSIVCKQVKSAKDIFYYIVFCTVLYASVLKKRAGSVQNCTVLYAYALKRLQAVMYYVV